MGLLLGVIASSASHIGCAGSYVTSNQALPAATCVASYSCDNASLTVCTDSSLSTTGGPVHCDGGLHESPNRCMHSPDIVVGCQVAVSAMGTGKTGCAILWYYAPLRFVDAQTKCADIGGMLVRT